MPQQVIVIGGGVAGLTAALHLAERGLRPLVLEADPTYAGGRLGGKPPATFPSAPGSSSLIAHRSSFPEFPAEHGIHGFWSQYRNLKGMLKRHGIMPRMVQANRQEWINGLGGKVRRVEMGRVVRRTWWPAPIHYGTLWF